MNSEELRLLFEDLAEKAIQWEYSYWLAKEKDAAEMMAELSGTGQEYYGKLTDLQKSFPELGNRIFYYHYGRSVRGDLGAVETDRIVTGDSPELWGADPERLVSCGEMTDASIEIRNGRKQYAVLNYDSDYLEEYTTTMEAGGVTYCWKLRDDAKYRRQELFKLSSVQEDVRRETRVSHGNIDIDASVRDAEFKMDGAERLLLGGYTVEQHAFMGNISDPLGYVGYQSSREDALAQYRAELEAKNTSCEDWTIYRGKIFTLSPQGFFIVDPDRKRIVLAALELQSQRSRIIRTEYPSPFRVPAGEKTPQIRELGKVRERGWSERAVFGPDHAAAMLYLADHFAEYMGSPDLSAPKPPEVRYPKVWCYFMRSVWLRQQGAVPE